MGFYEVFDVFALCSCFVLWWWYDLPVSNPVFLVEKVAQHNCGVSPLQPREGGRRVWGLEGERLHVICFGLILVRTHNSSQANNEMATMVLQYAAERNPGKRQ